MQAADAAAAAQRAGFDLETVFAKNNGRLQAEQAFKEVKIRENGREELAKIVAIGFIDWFAVQSNLSALRRIESGNDFGQGRFSAPVASCQENHFPGLK